MIQEENKAFPRTLSERIYNSLKEAIITGEIKANQRIQEKEIASSFKVSTTPVREAIRRLAGEGLVKVNSHRDVVVREISYKELMDIYRVMAWIDELSIRLTFERARDITREEVEKFIQELEKIANKENVEKWLITNEKMYLKICELSGNEFLYQIRMMINAQLGRYKPLRFFLFTREDVIEKSMKEFKRLLSVFKSKDKKALERLDSSHWLNFLPKEAEWIEYRRLKENTSSGR